MTNDQKDKVGGPAPTAETDRHAPIPHHPLLGALKGRVQVMPGTDLTQPADPEWGGVDREG
jgi:hypothetical protein